jgi:hypothetical protein
MLIFRAFFRAFVFFKRIQCRVVVFAALNFNNRVVRNISQSRQLLLRKPFSPTQFPLRYHDT